MSDILDETSLRRVGRCHVFGDAVPMDEGVMAFEYVIKRITDPQVLVPDRKSVV